VIRSTDKIDGRRLYLHYEGADTLSEGVYATSIPLLYAMDPQNDVMLAFGRKHASSFMHS
jgi:nitrate reductase (NAD(P)H)